MISVRRFNSLPQAPALWRRQRCRILSLGFWLMMRTYRAMKNRGTTHQFGATAQLLKDDVFSHSRNPMYLGMTAMLLGAALALRNLASLVAPLYFFVVIDQVFIPFEEKKMEEEVGETYLAYKRRVRRWL